MDKEGIDPRKGKYGWLPIAMPGVAKKMRERRSEFGDAFVNECWTRAMAGEPGWLFAREGGIAIGTPWSQDTAPEVANFAALQVTSQQVVFVIRTPEVQRGKN